ncbi:MAG: DUF1080 domain-containing protein [Bryobacteraceae bacterium]
MRVTLLLIGISAASLANQAERLTPIFDGRTLDGWEQLEGKAKFTAENGMIVGTAVSANPSSFLCTKKPYGDLILEFEVQVDGDLNSGVQIRSHTYKTATTVFVWRDGQWWKRVHPAGRVHGYQIEIANKITASGSIFDEGGRGWLNLIPGDGSAGKAFKDEEWNKYRIVAVGDSIKSWVNGILCADLVDPSDQSGFIGLQVHGFKPQRLTQVRWRNIRVQDLGEHTWQPLAKNVKMADFTVRMKFKGDKGDGNVFFRSGLRVASDGSLYDAAGRQLSKPDPIGVKLYYKPGDWNELAISAHGPRVVVHLNGIKTADVQTNVVKPGELKTTGGEVVFRDIEILRPVKP